MTPAWLHPLHEHLLARLDAEAQLRLDARTRLQVELWLTAAGERGWFTADPCSAQGGLRAILCKTAREQARFDEVFTRWLAAPDVGPGAVLAGPRPQGQGRGVGTGAGPGQVAMPWPARLWRFATSRSGLAVFALLVLGVALYLFGGATPEPVAPVPEPAASATFGTPTGPVLNLPMAVEVDANAFITLGSQPSPAAAVASAASLESSAASSPAESGSRASERWLLGIHPAVYAVLLLIAASALVAVQRTGQRFVGRISTRENLREQEVFARHLLPVSGARRHALRRAARALRRPRVVAGRSLDLLASVRASAQRAGLFQPVYRARQATPEYLVLVDRARPGDQQAHWAAEIARDLSAEGVSLTLYEFDRDPRWLAPLRTHRSAAAAPVQRTLPLAGVAAPHQGQGLIVLGDGDGLIDARSGRLHAWVATELAPWPRRVLLTPRPMGNWGSAEDQLAGAGQAADAASFLVLPAQIDALAAATHWLRDGRLIAIEALPGAPQQLPASLLDDPGRWLSRQAPEPQELVALVEQLRGALGPAAYTWLAASAAYPHLSADLTAFLAHRLGDGQPALADADADAHAAPGNDPRLLEARLIAIGQLPWCRHGLMPDWLRRALILSLPRPTRQRVRAVWTALFDQAGEHADRLEPAGATSLGRIATAGAAGGTGAEASWLADLRRRIGLGRAVLSEPADSPLRDVIYLGLLRGDLDAELSLQASEDFARAAANDLGPRLTWNVFRWLAAAGLVVGLTVRILARDLMERWAKPREPAARPAGRKEAADPAASSASAERRKFYLSARRSDAPGFMVNALVDGLTKSLGAEVIRSDAIALPPGTDMDSHLRSRLAEADVVLAVIGTDWLGARDGTVARNIDRVKDVVRMELELALRLGKPIFPVLLDDATVPAAHDLPESLRALADIHAVQIRAGQLRGDIEHLGSAIRARLAPAQAQASVTHPGRQGRKVK